MPLGKDFSGFSWERTLPASTGFAIHRARKMRALPGTTSAFSASLSRKYRLGAISYPLHHHSRATGTVFSCAWVRPRRMGDCSENTLSHGRDLEFMQPSRQPVRLLRYL